MTAHSEGCWLLNCITPLGWLERMTQYKDKAGKQESILTGLLDYPVLMAADILLYDAHEVPVGEDQKQHVELTRDIAQRFNHHYGETFVLPEAVIGDNIATLPGLDGRKMSKSYGNTIGIFDEGKVLKSKVMSIVTDSTPLEAPKDPERDNVFALIKLFASEAQQQEIAANYRAGGYGYGHAKKELLQLITDHFAGARERRKELEQRPDYVMDILRSHGKKARAKAQEYMARVREHAGLLTTY